MTYQKLVTIEEVIKRDGTFAKFEAKKIFDAIEKAFNATREPDGKNVEQVVEKVVEEIERKFAGLRKPTVEEIQDIVEENLMKAGYYKVAKSYILYRSEKTKEREARKAIVGETKTKMSLNGLRLLKERFLLKDKEGKVIETPEQMFERVARNIATADKSYGATEEEYQKSVKKFYELMSDLKFLPNAPTLYNAGTRLQQLSACFVLPVEDDMRGIYTSLMHQALIHQSGGGTGFSFTRLRPKGSMVRSTGGVASGPVSFMKVFNASTHQIKQGGKRRGANMGILRIDHPDVLEFINCKEKSTEVTNFNISVAITDSFMKAVEKDTDYDLIDPKTKHISRTENARSVFDMLVSAAWRNGDPGVVFIDRINKDNFTPQVGEIESTNPCIAGNSLVSSFEGLEEMQELKESEICTDNRVTTYSNENSSTLTRTLAKGVSFNKASKIWKSGKKKTLRLETKSGFELIATPEHKILTTEGWIELQKLEPLNHKVLLQGSKGSFSKDSALKLDLEKNSLNIPKEWSRELGQITGWLIGDGWISEKDPRVGFVFSKQDEKEMIYLKELIEGIYGKKTKVKEVAREVKHLTYHSKEFVEFFKALGVKAVKAGEKEIPKRFYTATEEAVKGLLQGLFSSDGTIGFVEGKSSYIRLTSKSKKLLKGTQLLLLNLGIKSKIYDRSRKAEKKFSYTTKSGEFKEYISDGILFELEVSKESVPKFLKEIGFIGEKHFEKIAKLESKGYYSENFEDLVAKVEEHKEIEVFDLTEPKTHSFIANGIVISNCGEVPLLPYESCNLGSIDVKKFAEEGEIQWKELGEAIETAVHFLDNVIDMNNYPLPEIEKITKANRKIGLGIMGYAQLLYKMRIKYDSEEAMEVAEKLGKFFKETADRKSIELAEKRGVFPNWKGSLYEREGMPKYRNATRLSIAPTGEISMLADTSAGIEPVFALTFVKRVLEGQDFLYIDEEFKQVAEEKGFYSQQLTEKMTNKGSIQDMEEIPEEVRKVFVVAFDIEPEWHVRTQGAFQKYVDLGISKTINFPQSATVEDVENTYLLAWKLGCKGITIYRDKSRDEQILNIEGDLKAKDARKKIELAPENIGEKGKCPKCSTRMVMQEGCATCPSCGYSLCTV